jgi:isorenieratene synthase
VRSWPVAHGDDQVTMSRGFHAFFRQYYNLRALLRRIDPDLQSLVAVADYPLILADSHADSFATLPRTPPLNIAAFVLKPIVWTPVILCCECAGGSRTAGYRFPAFSL